MRTLRHQPRVRRRYFSIALTPNLCLLRSDCSKGTDRRLNCASTSDSPTLHPLTRNGYRPPEMNRLGPCEQGIRGSPQGKACAFCPVRTSEAALSGLFRHFSRLQHWRIPVPPSLQRYNLMGRLVLLETSSPFESCAKTTAGYGRVAFENTAFSHRPLFVPSELHV